MTRRRAFGLAVAGLVVVLALVVRSLIPPHIEPAAQDGFVLTQVTVVNPGTDRRTNQTVVVRGGRVESVSDEPPELLPRLTRFLQGRFVLPGLIDMHVHLPPARGGLRDAFNVLFLSSGVTTVCQVGDVDDGLEPTLAAVRNGTAVGPRVLRCGQLFDGAGNTGVYSRRVPDAAAVDDAVASLVAGGVDCIVGSATLTAETLEAARAASQRRGVPFTGQLPPPLAGSEDARGGADDARQAVGFASRWEQLDADGMQRVAQRGAQMGIAYTPTLTAWARVTQVRDPGPLAAPLASLLPRFYRDLLWQPDVGLPQLVEECGSGALWLEIFRASDAAARERREARGPVVAAIWQVVARMRASGVRLHAGSNTPFPYVIPGVSLHEELARLVGLGLTPEDAWAAATGLAGDTLGIPLLGIIQAGAPADLLIFRDDPTHDLRALASLEAVVTDGRMYSARGLVRSRIDYAKYAARPLYDWLSMAVVRDALERGLRDGP